MPTLMVPRHRLRSSSMGDWGAAVTGLIANQELDQLNAAVRKLIDKLIAAIGQRAGLLKGYQEAKAAYQNAQQKFGPAFIFNGITQAPNIALVPFMLAFTSARKGVELMAREVQTMGFLDRIFTQVSVALTKAGLSNDANSIDQALAQIRRFNLETDNMFFTQAPEYHQAKQAILQQANAEWAALGVAKNAYDDPKWMAGYLRAAQRVVPIENLPQAPPAVLEAGMGALPLLGALLVWTIGIVVAGFVLSEAISRVLPDQNSKAKTAEKLLLAYQEQKAQEAAQMRAAGASDAQINARMAAIDEEAKRAVAAVPDPPSMLKWILIPALVLGGGYAVGKAVGWI